MTIGTQRQNNIGAVPGPTGKWVDTRTGNIRTVKTLVDDMSGSGAVIMFTDGDVIPFREFSIYYIQESDADESNRPTADIADETKPRKLNRGLLTRGLCPSGDGEVDNFSTVRTPARKAATVSKQKQLLIDLFNKTEEYPTIDAENILIKNIPTDALKTLHDYFDVAVDDIADILMEKCIDKSALRQSVINNINSILSN